MSSSSDAELRTWARWGGAFASALRRLEPSDRLRLESGESLVPFARGASGIVYDAFLRELAARIVAAAAGL